MILYKSFHNINVNANTFHTKQMPEDFNEFVDGYIAFAIRNNSNKSYNITDPNTTVIHCITSVLQEAVLNPTPTEDQKQRMDQFSNSIANKLLREEVEVQKKISVMGTQVKLGSLLQALIKTDAGEYLYIIAKVEHSEWYDGESLIKTFGFPSEKKNVWKSAVFTLLYDEDGIKFDPVKVYTDNKASYWANNFLELTEERTDETNTIAALHAVDTTLYRKVKKKSKSDYYHLRNTIITTLKSPNLINYPEMVNNIVGLYQPDDPSLDMQILVDELKKLPEKNNFDSQFRAVPAVINKMRHLKFAVSSSIELNIAEGCEDYMDHITSYEAPDGVQYLRIRCSINETYDLFLHKDEKG